MKSNTRHLLAVSVFVIIGSILVYLLLDAIYALPVAASAEAGPIDLLFRAHFILIAFLFALIVVFMLYSVVAFRRRPGDETDGEHFHGNTVLEIVWTAVPLILVIVFGIWGQQTLNTISAEEGNELTVNVVGYQWYWEFEYPAYQNFKTTNEMVLPVDEPVMLRLSSKGLGPQDPGVNHAFWIPEFRVKRDLIPGKDYHLRITPTQMGRFKLRCAELCGTGHAIMLADVRVVSQAEFEQWASDTAAAQSAVADLSPPERGAYWATNAGCGGCHNVDGSPGGVGPTWLGLFGREEQLTDGSTIIADEAYLYESIVDPNASIVAGYAPNVMPAIYGDTLTDDQINDIIEYIKSLSEN